MKEISFLQKNQERWKAFEKLLEGGYRAKPDDLSGLFIQITDDLAYSKTYYPGTNTTEYLNYLARKAHQLVYRSKPVQKNRFVSFWKYDYPVLIYSVRKEVWISFLIFGISLLIGIISTIHDPGFERIILGNDYVNQTLFNISQGDPLAIYKSMNQADMFLGISVNNIIVSFVTFLFGVFTSIGTGLKMVETGIMVGTFQTFIAQKGFFLESVATIWIHGTLEIFAIIIAGAAGLVMGNSMLFPGTLSRIQSFRNGAIKGIKIVTGLIPVFVIAAFLEGFVTRYTQAPYSIRFGIILLSLIFILFYFFLYPRHLILKSKHYGKHTY